MVQKIVVLKGSPRVNGNSAVLADQAIKGATEAGAEVESFVLHNMHIEPCNHCDNCQETGGICNIKDEMQTLYPKLRQADGIIIASPIYWFSISAQLKLCIDRWYAFETDEGNQLMGKNFGIVLTYGDTDLHSSGGINAVQMFESIFGYIGAEIVNIVHGSAMNVGDAQKEPELMEKAFELGQQMVAQ